MNGKRQKTRTTQQLRLAFAAEGRDESPDDRRAGTVPDKTNSRPMSPTSSDRLMERICGPMNFNEAITKVVANDGAPGVDGMKVSGLGRYFERHRPRIIGELVSGTYRPQPVMSPTQTWLILSISIPSRSKLGL